MTPTTKKILKWTGITVGAIVILLIAAGIYIYTLIPPAIGTPVVLNRSLFAKPDRPYPMEGKYIYKSATELAAMIRHGEATSFDVVTEYINNIKNNNYKYNAIIWLREKEALEEAKKADEMVMKGDTFKTLLGVPVTIKEHFWVTGSPSTLNAKMFGFTAPRDAAIVKQIKREGAVILGTTNVPFMLSDYQTAGEVYPTGNNPFDTTRTPGGSTGGGAAAVAAGFTTLELGSDLGGSVRLPAGFCGVYGLKSSFNTLNILDGSSPDTVNVFNRFSMACPGPLARTPEDLELFWNVLKDADSDNHFSKKTDWKPASGKSLDAYRIAWIDEWVDGKDTVKISSVVKEKINAFVDSLNAHQAKLTKTAPGNHSELKRQFLAEFGSMMSENQPWALRQLIKMDMGKLNPGGPEFEAFDESMDDASDARWQKVEADAKNLQDKWAAFFKNYDLMICPLSYGPAFKKCVPGTPIEYDGTTIAYLNYVPYSYIFNPINLPALVIPMGLTKEGLPVSIQVVGPLYSEPELLYFAKLVKPFTPGFVKPGT